MLGGLIGFLGIGFFALPVGIVGSGFVEVMLDEKQRRREGHTHEGSGGLLDSQRSACPNSPGISPNYRHPTAASHPSCVSGNVRAADDIQGYSQCASGTLSAAGSRSVRASLSATLATADGAPTAAATVPGAEAPHVAPLVAPMAAPPMWQHGQQPPAEPSASEAHRMGGHRKDPPPAAEEIAVLQQLLTAVRAGESGRAVALGEARLRDLQHRHSDEPSLGSGRSTEDM